MIRGRLAKIVLATVLVGLVAGGGYLLVRAHQQADHVEVTAYFDNSNGVFAGDDVRIRGVNVGKIERIEPEPSRVKITFRVRRQVTCPPTLRRSSSLRRW